MIVEDDKVIENEISQFLKTWGYDIALVEDYNQVLSTFVNEMPSLVLLDITLPFHNGFYWCQKIREVSNVPLIFISSASDNMNMVMAMSLGADDFIAKPFNLTFLNAKISALLRRSYDYQVQNHLLEWQGAILNLAEASLSKDGQVLSLTKNEFKILETLVENKGQVISRDTLMIKLWETDFYVDENTLNVNVNRLRRKLEALGLKDVIITKKGIGYLAV
jgi:Response regulators consisting of a CheY-like receiver domain and a winged-helix DNA-binding domain